MHILRSFHARTLGVGALHRMKICPHCESGFDDRHVTCPTHGVLLSEIRDLRPGLLIRDTYRIIRKLGKGGMGAVYLAEHILLEEPRALKFLAADLVAEEGFTTRFLREVRTLRQVRNKNIVDCGDPERAEDGSLFYSMEFVDGPSLREFVERSPRPFDVKTALAITHGIAEGLGAAHAKGLVHRDIKPDNILLAREDGKWVPKIVDFGIVATKENSHQTRTGSVLLTMAYAAPEQWTGTRAADLDGRTDLYALGSALFEMLTGRSAFDAENFHEWAQKHLYAMPPVPSSIRPDLAQWNGLDRLILRLLAKDRAQRPANVQAMLAELDAITYIPPAPIIPAAPVFPRASAPPIDQPPLASASVVSASRPRPTNPQAATPVPPPTPPPLREAAPELDREPPPRRAGSSGNTGSASRPVTLRVEDDATDSAPPAEGQLRDADNESRNNPIWFWIILIFLLVGGGITANHFLKSKPKFVTLSSQGDSILSIAFSSDGQTLASASHNNTIQFWNIATDKPLSLLQDHVDAIAFSPDGHSLAAAGWDNKVRQWDANSGKLIATLEGHTEQVLCVAFGPDSRMLASGSRDKTIRLWDLATARTVRVLQGQAGDVNAVAFSPDGNLLASGGSDNTVLLWNVNTGTVVRTLKGHTGPVNTVAFSPDGRTLASGSDDNTINLWDAETGKLLRTLTGNTGAVRSVAFSPDGNLLASGSDDDSVRIWRLQDNARAFATLQGQNAPINAVAFSHDGALLASASNDTTIRLWVLSSIH